MIIYTFQTMGITIFQGLMPTFQFGISTPDSRPLPTTVGNLYSQPLLSLLYHPSFRALIRDTMAPLHGYPPCYGRGSRASNASSSRH
jgi:hypothetical protein